MIELITALLGAWPLLLEFGLLVAAFLGWCVLLAEIAERRDWAARKWWWVV